MSGMRTHCSWDHLVQGFRDTPLLRGIITDRDTITKIIFTTPVGVNIEVPEGSRMELHVDQVCDMYAIGFEYEPGSVGMTHGPHPDLSYMLGHCPPDPKAKLFCCPRGEEAQKVTHVAVSNTEGELEWEAIDFDPEDDSMGAEVES